MAGTNRNIQNRVYPIEGLRWLPFPDDNTLQSQGIVVSVRNDKSASARSRIESAQYVVSLREIVDNIVNQAVISGNKWDVQDETIPINNLRSGLNFTGPGVVVSDAGAGPDRLDVTIPSDMEKAVYDSNDDGVVNSADEVFGVQTTGPLKYYGTDQFGTPGFFDAAFGTPGHIINSNQYDPNTGLVNDVVYTQRLNLNLGPEFNVQDEGAGPDQTNVIDTAYATQLNGAILSVAVGGIAAGESVASLRGTPYFDLLDQIIFPAVPAVYTQPTVDLAVDVGTPAGPNYIKSGVSTDIQFTSTFNQNDAGAVNNYDLNRDGSSIDNDVSGSVQVFTDNISEFLPGGIFNLIIDYQAEFDHDIGPVLNDSHGNPSPPAIPAGQVLSNVVQYQIIYPYFFGASDNPIPTAVDIAAATEVIEPATETQSVQISSNIDQYIFLAIPADNAFVYNWWSLDDGNSGRVGALNFIRTIRIPVQDPGLLWTASYDIYVATHPSEVTNRKFTLSVEDVLNS